MSGRRLGSAWKLCSDEKPFMLLNKEVVRFDFAISISFLCSFSVFFSILFGVDSS